MSKESEKIRNSKLASDDAVSTAQYVLILQDSVANFSFLGRSSTRNFVKQNSTDSGASTGDPKKDLIELHARLKQAQIRARACEKRWKHLVVQCEKAEVRKQTVLSCFVLVVLFCYAVVDVVFIVILCCCCFCRCCCRIKCFTI